MPTFVNRNLKRRQPNIPKNRRLKRRPKRILPSSRVSKVIKSKMRVLRRYNNNPNLRGGGSVNYSTMRARPEHITRGRDLRISPAGMCFLKCAFAPPDFASTMVRGIPDNFRGMSLLKQHHFTGQATMVTGLDHYFLLCPVPGIAYFYLTLPAGTALTAANAVFLPAAYADLASLFGNENTAANTVNSFRLISNHLEIINTSNSMNWSGSITSFKLPIKHIIRYGGVDLHAVTGLDGINSTSSNIYSAAFRDGIYTGCYNTGNDFPFIPVLEGVATAKIPFNIQASDFGQLDCSSAGAIPGFYNDFESSIIKVTGLTTNVSYIIKAWSCVEYTVVPSSVLYGYQSISPQCDTLALRAYREIVLSLPVAVTSRENANFWQRVLSILRTITMAGSYIPGPVGGISRGANMITNGIASLSM